MKKGLYCSCLTNRERYKKRKTCSKPQKVLRNLSAISTQNGPTYLDIDKAPKLLLFVKGGVHIPSKAICPARNLASTTLLDTTIQGEHYKFERLEIDHPIQKLHSSPLGVADADKQNSSAQLTCVCLSLSHLTDIHVSNCGEMYG